LFVQLLEHLPKNRALGFLEYNVPEAAIVFEVFLWRCCCGSSALRARRQDQSWLVKDGDRPVWPPTLLGIT
jgi:hypothetical protein